MNDKPALGAELFAEFLGTLVLILFGTGVVAMVVLFPTNNAGELIHGGYTNITIGWGLGVTMGIYVAGRISGAHLNPAVTLTLAVFRGFPWRKVVPLLVWRRRREHLSQRHWFIAIIFPRFTGSILDWRRRPVCSLLFQPSRSCRRQDFWIR